MGKLISFLAALFLSLDGFAAGIRFEPPAPDNRSWITAQVYSYWCGALDPNVTVTGNQIEIQLVEVGACPAISFFVPLKAQIGLLRPGIYTVRLRRGMDQQPVAQDILVVRDTMLAIRVGPRLETSTARQRANDVEDDLRVVLDPRCG